MTNVEIIGNEMLLRGITEECNTYARWKSMGYKVRKGEHALFETRLWKHTTRTKKNKQTGEDEEQENMYMTKAYLFGKHQVDKIEEGK